MSMSQPTLLFYDLETSGLQKTFDQVVEFAAIRTTMDLVEIERHHIYVQLTKDTVPAPDAFITHQIGLEQLAQHGVPEAEAITTIHRLLNQPGTISLGYNTLGFDDVFLRFSFARSLLPPYTHQYQHGCGRLDLYPLVLLYFLYKPQVIKWPTVEDRPSMKLEHIAAENGWLTGQAHHAMTDVEATLALAKALASAEAMWQFAFGYFTKASDWSRIQSYHSTLPNLNAPLAYISLLVSGKAGYARRYLIPALCLGVHKQYTNQVVWLRLDDETLPSTIDSTEAFSRLLIRKKLGEPPIALPYKEKYYTAMPESYRTITEANIAWIAEQADWYKTIQTYALNWQYPEVPNVDLDANLYQLAFPSKTTQLLCQDLLAALRQSADSSLLASFQDPIMQQKAIRYIWRFYDHLLPTAYHEAISVYWQQVLQPEDVLIDFAGRPRYSPEAAMARITELTQQPLTPVQQAVLTQLSTYIAQHFAVTATS